MRKPNELEQAALKAQGKSAAPKPAPKPKPKPTEQAYPVPKINPLQQAAMGNVKPVRRAQPGPQFRKNPLLEIVDPEYKDAPSDVSYTKLLQSRKGSLPRKMMIFDEDFKGQFGENQGAVRDATKSLFVLLDDQKRAGVLTEDEEAELLADLHQSLKTKQVGRIQELLTTAYQVRDEYMLEAYKRNKAKYLADRKAWAQDEMAKSIADPTRATREMWQRDALAQAEAAGLSPLDAPKFSNLNPVDIFVHNLVRRYGVEKMQNPFMAHQALQWEGARALFNPGTAVFDATSNPVFSQKDYGVRKDLDAPIGSDDPDDQLAAFAGDFAWGLLTGKAVLSGASAIAKGVAGALPNSARAANFARFMAPIGEASTNPLTVGQVFARTGADMGPGMLAEAYVQGGGNIVKGGRLIGDSLAESGKQIVNPKAWEENPKGNWLGLLNFTALGLGAYFGGRELLNASRLYRASSKNPALAVALRGDAIEDVLAAAPEAGQSALNKALAEALDSEEITKALDTSAPKRVPLEDEASVKWLSGIIKEQAQSQQSKALTPGQKRNATKTAKVHAASARAELEENGVIVRDFGDGNGEQTFTSTTDYLTALGENISRGAETVETPTKKVTAAKPAVEEQTASPSHPEAPVEVPSPKQKPAPKPKAEAAPVPKPKNEVVELKPTTPRKPFVLPRELSRSSPNYGRATIEFSSDYDKTAYILARDHVKPSKSAAKFRQALVGSGESVEAAIAHGQKVIAELKRVQPGAAPQVQMKIKLEEVPRGATPTLKLTKKVTGVRKGKSTGSAYIPTLQDIRNIPKNLAAAAQEFIASAKTFRDYVNHVVKTYGAKFVDAAKRAWVAAKKSFKADPNINKQRGAVNPGGRRKKASPQEPSSVKAPPVIAKGGPPPVLESPDSTIRVRHAEIKARLKEAGIEWESVKQVIGDEEVFANAKSRGYVERAGDIAEAVVKGKRSAALNSEERAGLILAYQTNRGKQRQIFEQLKTAKSVEDHVALMDHLEELDSAQVKIDEAFARSSSEAGRALRLARMQWKDGELDLPTIRNMFQGASRETLTPGLETKAKEMAATIARLEQELADARSAMTKKAAQPTQGDGLPPQRRPKSAEVLQKAEAEWKSWLDQWGAKTGVKPTVKAGAALNPGVLLEGAYHYAKFLIAKGYRDFDEIYKILTDSGITLDRKAIAAQVRQADIDLKRPPNKGEMKQTLRDLRKQIADELGDGPEGKYQQALKDIEALEIKITKHTTEAELAQIRKQIGDLAKTVNPGKTEGMDIVRKFGPKGELVEDANVRAARVKLDRERRKVVKFSKYLRDRSDFKLKTGMSKLLAYLGEGLGTVKGLSLSGDLGMLARQGGIPLSTRPKTLKRALAALKQSITEQGFDDVMNSIATDDYYDVALDGGLRVGAAQEEDFVFNIFDLLKKDGKRSPVIDEMDSYLKFNDRTYTAVLHRVRMDLFSQFARGMEMKGGQLSTTEAKMLAAFINDLTGAASFGKGEVAVKPLNTILLSARYYASRIKMLFYNHLLALSPKTPKRVRNVILKEYGRFVSFMGAVGFAVQLAGEKYTGNQKRKREALRKELAKAKAQGAKGAVVKKLEEDIATLSDQIIEMRLDPRDSGMFTFKVGDVRYDFSAGLRPFANLAARLSTTYADNLRGKIGEERTPNYITMQGKVKSDAGYGSTSNPLDLVSDALWMRSNPVPRILLGNYAEGKVFGRETTMTQDAARAGVPLVAQIPYDSAKEAPAGEEGSAAVKSLLGNFLGVGNYEAPLPHKRTRDKEFKDRQNAKKAERKRQQQQSPMTAQ